MIRNKKLYIISILFILILLFNSCTKKEDSYYPVVNAGEKLGYSFINQKGEFINTEVYEDILKNYEKGYAIVKKNNEIKIVDVKGNDILNKGFNYVYEIKDNIAIVKEGDKSTCYDLSTKEALFSYEFIKMQSNGIFAFMDNGKWGYRNKSKVIIEPTYDEAFSFGNYNALVSKNGTVYKVNKNAKEERTKYKEIVRIDLSNFVIGINEVNDLLNLDGEILINSIPGDIVDFKEDKLAYVSRIDGHLKTGIIDVHGNIIIDPIYEDIRLLNGNFFANKKNGKFALFNIKNEKLTNYEFDYLDASHFDSNGGIISALKDNKPVFIDKNGVAVPSPSINNATYVDKDKNLFIIGTQDGLYYFNNDFVLICFSANPVPLGNLVQVPVKELGMDFIKLYGNNLPEITNDVLLELINKRSSINKRQIVYNLIGDILYISVNDGDFFEMMFDINKTRIIKLEDIFKEKYPGEMEIILKNMANIDKNSTLIGFVLDKELSCYFIDNEKTNFKIDKYTFDYDKIEEYIKFDENDFFKAKLKPIINVEE